MKPAAIAVSDRGRRENQPAAIEIAPEGRSARRPPAWTQRSATSARSAAIEIAPEGRSARRPPAWTGRSAALIPILFLAACMRAVGLTRGLWLDEIANVGVLTRPAVMALFNIEITTARSPLFFALYRPWLAVAGDSAFAARWPALLCGVLSVALMGRVGRAWAGPRAGLAAALLLALNPLHIWYSQEASFYTFVSALALLAVWQATTPANGIPRRRLLLLALSLALLLAASLWTIFLVAALGLWVLIWRRRQSRLFLTALLVALLLAAPALAVYLQGVVAGWSTPTTRPGLPLAQMAYSLLTLSWGFAVGPPPEALRQALAGGTGLRALAQQHLGWLLLAAAPWFLLPLAALRSRLFPRPRPPTQHNLGTPISGLQSPVSNLVSRPDLPRHAFPALVLLWLGVPLLGANLLTWWAQTNFNVRYILFALPALLLGIAMQDRRWVGVAVVLSTLFWLRGVSDPAFAQEDLQQPVQFLQTAVQPADLLLLRAPEVYLLAPLAFYGAPIADVVWYNSDTAASQTPAAFSAQQTAGRCRIWLWSARAWLVDRHDALPAALTATATPAATWRWPGSELTLFQRARCP